MKPPIITLSPICTKARVLILPSRDAGVADGLGVGVTSETTPLRVVSGITNPCARNPPAATTVNARAVQKSIRILPQSPPMYEVDQKWACLASTKTVHLVKSGRTLSVSNQLPSR